MFSSKTFIGITGLRATLVFNFSIQKIEMLPGFPEFKQRNSMLNVYNWKKFLSFFFLLQGHNK